MSSVCVLNASLMSISLFVPKYYTSQAKLEKLNINVLFHMVLLLLKSNILMQIFYLFIYKFVIEADIDKKLLTY